MKYLVVGAAVEARFKGRSRFFAGKIRRKRVDGTFDINFDDGEIERHVTRDRIRIPTA